MELDGLKARITKGVELEDLLRDSAAELCEALRAERITVYRVVEDGAALLAIVQTGLESFGAVKVRIDSKRSVVGYVGARRTLVNIANAYDDKELAPLELERKMFMAVDERTGFRTREVLAAPVLSAGGELLGAVELLNCVDRQRFPKQCEDDLLALCATLVPAFKRAGMKMKTAQ